MGYYDADDEVASVGLELLTREQSSELVIY